MINELKRQMSRDLNITKFKGEMEREYNQRLIYSGLAAWVRSLICGNSLADLEGDVAQKFPDIMYVQSNLTKIAEAFLCTFETDENWIEVEDAQEKSSVLASEIIQQMIELGEIAEVNSRQLTPVPKKKIRYNDWIRIKGNDTYERSCMSVGVAQWTNEKYEETEEEYKLVDIKGTDYIDFMLRQFDWVENYNLTGTHEIFKVGSEHKYSKSWIPMVEHKLSEGVFLVREANTFEPGYTLVWKIKDSIKACHLDPWYVSSREIYRIMYALNFKNGTPAKFRIKDMGDYFVLFYPSRLPEAENKLFFSLSWPNNSVQGRFSRIFPKQFLHLISENIENIGAYIGE